MEDRRIAWLIENVPSFKPAYEAAEKARQETEAYREKYASCPRVRKEAS